MDFEHKIKSTGILQMAGKMMGEEGNTGLEGLTRYGWTEDTSIGVFDIRARADGTYVKFADVERLLADRAAAEKPTGDLTDEQAWKIATDLFGTVRYVSREDEYVKIENAADAGQFARAAIAAHLERQVQATSAPEQVSAIGRLLDEFSALPVLWGLDEPGALVRHSDVFKMLVAAGKTYLAPASQEGAHAARNAVLEEAAEKLEYMNDSAGDRAAHEGRDMTCCETERMWALKSAAEAIRGLQTPACAERSGDHE